MKKYKLIALALAALLFCGDALAAWDKTKPTDAGLLRDAPQQLRDNWQAIETGTDSALLITNAKVSPTAGIVDTKLAQITTADKVHGSAFTGLGSIPNSGDGQIPLANGGTNKNLSAVNGGVLYTDADSAEVSAAGSSGQILRSAGAGAPTWSTATYPATAGSAGKIAQSDGTNIAMSTPTWPTSASTSGKVVASDGTNLVMSAYTVAAPGTSGNVMTSDGSNWGSSTPIFSGSYTSTDQTITAAGSLTLAHGLGAVPAIVQVMLVCQSGELGYSTNDVVLINPMFNSHDASDRGVSLVLDSTNINVRYGANATSFSVIRKDNGTGSAIDNSKWKLRVKAWK